MVEAKLTLAGPSEVDVGERSPDPDAGATRPVGPPAGPPQSPG